MSDSKFAVVHGYSAEKRAQIRDAAETIGVDEAYLSLLVDEFYSRVRADERLGPIFIGEIGNDWAGHLERMKAFWASVALNAGVYSGRPVPVHQKLVGVERSDFGRWLGLFRDTLDDTAPTPEAANYLLIRAERIARSLEIAMFERMPDGVPSLG